VAPRWQGRGGRLRTKGDANALADPWTFQLDQPIQPKMRVAFDWLGFPVLWLAGTGQVTLAVTDEGGPARIRVEDEGDGIAAGLAGRIFERHVSREGSGGEGIGLALARQLVVTLGGRLVLVPGSPTTFDVLLPSQLVLSRA
jgi:hypothetical protein